MSEKAGGCTPGVMYSVRCTMYSSRIPVSTFEIVVRGQRHRQMGTERADSAKKVEADPRPPLERSDRLSVRRLTTAG